MTNALTLNNEKCHQLYIVWTTVILSYRTIMQQKWYKNSVYEFFIWFILFYPLLFFYTIYLFLRDRELARMNVGRAERGRQMIWSALCVMSTECSSTGLKLTNPRLWPKQKSGVISEPPRSPNSCCVLHFNMLLNIVLD